MYNFITWTTNKNLFKEYWCFFITPGWNSWPPRFVTCMTWVCGLMPLYFCFLIVDKSKNTYHCSFKIIWNLCKCFGQCLVSVLFYFVSGGILRWHYFKNSINGALTRKRSYIKVAGHRWRLMQHPNLKQLWRHWQSFEWLAYILLLLLRQPGHNYSSEHPNEILKFMVKNISF